VTTTATAFSAASTRHRVAGLDGIRAIAAYGVIATHVGFETGRSLKQGFLAGIVARLDFGVTLFFLLSGFVIYRPFAAAVLAGGPLPDIRTFLRRRALRILPAYWLVIVLTLGLLSLRPASWGDWTSYLLLVQIYNHHNVDSSLSQMWTLSTELSFYLILPLIVLLVRRICLHRNWPARENVLLSLPFGMALLAFSWRMATSAHPALWYPGLLWLPAQLDWFALGMLLATLTLPLESGLAAKVRAICQAWASEVWTCLAIGIGLFLLATLPLAGPRSLLVPTVLQSETKHFLYGGAAFFMILPIVLSSATALHRVLSQPLLARLGEISYGVYLWHLPLLILIQRRWLDIPLFRGRFIELYALTAASATVLAAVSYYLFERPILRRWSTRATRVPAIVAADTPITQST
jgi:peptidoglycan/LPS O-acetylase OafA/YrhL